MLLRQKDQKAFTVQASRNEFKTSMKKEDGQLRAKENIYTYDKKSKQVKNLMKKDISVSDLHQLQCQWGIATDKGHWPKRLFFFNFYFFTFIPYVYIFFRSKLSVLVFHTSFKLIPRGLDCKSLQMFPFHRSFISRIKFSKSLENFFRRNHLVTYSLL